MSNLPTTLQNPGDLKDPKTGQLRKFNSPIDGKAALYNDLTSKMTGTSTTGIGPNSSLVDFAKVYAPTSDKNDPIQYAANLANKMKVSPDTQIGTLKGRIDDFANAVSDNEGYQSDNGLGSFNQTKQSQTENTDTNTTRQTPAEPKKTNGFVDFLNSIEAPFIGLAATPVQALAKVTGQPDPFQKGFPGLADSNVPVTDLNLEKKVGDAAQVGSYFVPGEGMLGAAGMGALQGGGNAMSQGGDLAKVAVGTGEGTLLGAATAGLTKFAGAGLNKVGELMSGEGMQKAIQGFKDAYSSALNLNASDRAFENRSGKDLANVLFQHKVPLGRYEDGTLDASGAISKLQAILKPLNQEADNVLSHPQGVVHNISLPEIETSLHTKIDSMVLPNIEKKAAKKEISEYLVAEMEKYGGDVPPDVADKIKQGFWASTFDKNRTNLQNHLPYLIGKEMQSATEKAVAGTDTETNLHILNQKRSDLIDAIRRLQKMDGVKLLKGGKLGNMAGGLTGTIIGSHFGPLGGLAGDYFGTKAAEFLNNPSTRIGLGEAKIKATGLLPKLIGKTGQGFGKNVSRVAGAIKSPLPVRGAGLLANLVSNGR